MQDDNITKISLNGYNTRNDGIVFYNVHIEHKGEHYYTTKRYSELKKYSKLFPQVSVKFPSDMFIMLLAKTQKNIKQRMERMNAYFHDLCISAQIQQSECLRCLLRQARKGPQSINLRGLNLKQHELHPKIMIISN